MKIRIFKNIASWFKSSSSSSKKVDLDPSLVCKVVEVQFYDPRKVGIMSRTGRELTCTRFNHDEFENRKFVGIVTNFGNWEGGPSYGKYIEVEVYKKNSGKRVFLLLENEIESIRIVE